MKITRYFALAFTALALLIAPTFTGCAGLKPASAERAAHTTIASSDSATYTALRVWAEGFARREAANEATKKDDPGGYIDRRTALAKEQGKVSDMQARYSAAVQSAIAVWLKAKESGLPVPQEATTTAAIDTLRKDIESLNR